MPFNDCYRGRCAMAAGGRRLPLGAGTAMQPFADMGSLSTVCLGEHSEPRLSLRSDHPSPAKAGVQIASPPSRKWYSRGPLRGFEIENERLRGGADVKFIQLMSLSVASLMFHTSQEKYHDHT